MRSSNKQYQSLSKYVPNSPVSSPHKYDQDSFQAEQLSRELPVPTPQMHGSHNYQLTFKKDMQQHYFFRDSKSHTDRALFNASQNRLIDQIRQPLEKFYRKPMEELASLPFADLVSLQLAPIDQVKLELIGEILEVKRMRMKISSVSINLECLKIKENLSYQDKNRLFLLELLWKQLSKKLFLESLKLNQSHNKYMQEFGQIESKRANDQSEYHPHIQEQYQQNQQSHLSRSQNNLWQNEELSRQEASQEQQEQSYENMQQKLMIFVHGVTLVIQKILFFSFHKLAKAAENLQNQKFTVENECKSIPIVSRPNIVDDSSQYSKYRHENQYKNVQNDEAQISQSKLEELYSFIQALHEQCAQSENILRKYFIKWKINLLESIAESLLNKMRGNSMNEVNEDEEDMLSNNLSQHQEQEQLKNDLRASRESRYTSQLSQGENSLKNQKRQLKEFLKKNSIRMFYSQLRDYYELRKISSICQQMKKQNILRKSFNILKQNVKQRQFQREMQAYYEQTADNQVQDDGTSRLFHKTSLLFSYFNKFKQNLRDQKMMRTLQSVMMKLVFRRLCSFGFKQKKQNQLVLRRLEHMRNRMMFKYFSTWKQFYLNENSFNERFRTYMKIKDKQILQHYFSLLKLGFKRSLLKERKVDQIYQNRLKERIFGAFKNYYEENRQLNERVQCLESYLIFSRGRGFIKKFKSYYFDYIEYQRFSIKQEKLKRTLIRLHALQSIKQWRKNQLKKHAYEAIEMKLVRYKNKQRKREIFTSWYQRTLQILQRNGSSNQSQKHKDWLVKYYGDLCSFLPS